jgi:hypothetical protein
MSTPLFENIGPKMGFSRLLLANYLANPSSFADNIKS